MVNSVFLLKFYTTGKNFTLPPAVTGVTNITSGMRDSIHFDRQSQRNRHFNHFRFNKHLELENVICCLLKLHSFLCQISIPSRCLKSFCHFPSRSCPIFCQGLGVWIDGTETILISIVSVPYRYVLTTRLCTGWFFYWSALEND